MSTIVVKCINKTVEELEELHAHFFPSSVPSGISIENVGDYADRVVALFFTGSTCSFIDSTRTVIDSYINRDRSPEPNYIEQNFDDIVKTYTQEIEL